MCPFHKINIQSVKTITTTRDSEVRVATGNQWPSHHWCGGTRGTHTDATAGDRDYTGCQHGESTGPVASGIKRMCNKLRLSYVPNDPGNSLPTR